VSGKFTRGPIPVTVTRRPADPDGLVRVSCGADPDTAGYRIAYRGTVEQAIACLEACQKKLWEYRAAGKEPEIQP
jgi:hypothetical protein